MFFVNKLLDKTILIDAGEFDTCLSCDVGIQGSDPNNKVFNWRASLTVS